MLCRVGRLQVVGMQRYLTIGKRQNPHFISSRYRIRAQLSFFLSSFPSLVKDCRPRNSVPEYLWIKGLARDSDSWPLGVDPQRCHSLGAMLLKPFNFLPLGRAEEVSFGQWQLILSKRWAAKRRRLSWKTFFMKNPWRWVGISGVSKVDWWYIFFQG